MLPKKNDKLLGSLNYHIVDFLSTLPKGEMFYANAESNSMHPTIKIGQKVCITRSSFLNLKIGEIIAYTVDSKERIIVHRIVEKNTIANKRSYYVKGDHNRRMDANDIFENDFVGKIILPISLSNTLFFVQAHYLHKKRRMVYILNKYTKIKI